MTPTIRRPSPVNRSSRRLAAGVSAGLALTLLGALSPAAADPRRPLAQPTSSCTAQTHLEGSYLQAPLADSLSPAQMSQEMTILRNACMNFEVINWTVDTGTNETVYPTDVTGMRQGTKTDVVEKMLAAADGTGIQVFVGLGLDDRWWQAHASDAAFAAEHTREVNAIADELYARYSHHRSFAGWYIPLESDNWSYDTPEKWTQLASFYRGITSHLDTLNAKLPVMTSPFFNPSGGIDASRWTQMWTQILPTAGIDILAMQDGAGASNATPAQIAEWFAATRRAVTATGGTVQLWDDAETFTTGFIPMPIAQVVTNIKAAAPYVSRFLSFSYDHYDSPLQGFALQDRTYRDYLRTGVVEANVPTAPQGLTATAVNAVTARLSWTKGTDDIGVAGHEVWRDGIKVATVMGSSSTYVDESVQPERTYSYTVKDFDAAGNRSASSTSASVTLPPAPPTPNVLSAGRSYTSSEPASSSYPDAGGELTDGVHGSTDYLDPAWQGRLTNAEYTLTVDLGSVRSVDELDTTWLQSPSVGISLPSKIVFEVSTDGNTYTAVKTLSSPAVAPGALTHTFRAIELGASARYVRVRATPGSAWSFIDEIEARSK